MTYIELIEHCSNMGENSCAGCKFEKLCDKFYEIDIDKEIINDEIIRCKDCIFYDNICGYCNAHSRISNRYLFSDGTEFYLNVEADDYCSKSKRKDDGK